MNGVPKIIPASVKYGTTGATKISSTVPTEYRLVNRKGELTLQGKFTWQRGLTTERGFEWRDIPTVIEN